VTWLSLSTMGGTTALRWLAAVTPPSGPTAGWVHGQRETAATGSSRPRSRWASHLRSWPGSWWTPACGRPLRVVGLCRTTWSATRAPSRYVHVERPKLRGKRGTERNKTCPRGTRRGQDADVPRDKTRESALPLPPLKGVRARTQATRSPNPTPSPMTALAGAHHASCRASTRFTRDVPHDHPHPHRLGSGT